MRANQEPGLSDDQNPTPVATWRVPSALREKPLSNGTDALWQRALLWVFLSIGVAYLVAARTNPTDGSIGMHLKALAIVAITQICLFIIYRRFSTHLESAWAFRGLRKRVPVTDAVPVEIELFQDQTLTGSDRGFVWFEGNTLYFKGVQTAFHLSRIDVAPLSLWPKRFHPKANQLTPPRWIHIPIGFSNFLDLKVVPIDPFEDHDARRRALLFDKQVVAWINDSPTEGSDTLLPPTALHPGLSVEKAARRGILAGATLVFLNVAIVTLELIPFANPHQGWLRALSIATSLALLGFSLRLGILENRDFQNRVRVTLRDSNP